MRKRLMISIVAAVFVLVFASLTLAQISGKSLQEKAPTAAAPAFRDDLHNLSGVWFTKPRAGRNTIESTDDLQQPVDLTLRPPMTPWAQQRYTNNVPHGGPRAIAGKDNDPILRCYPDGLPKVLRFPSHLKSSRSPEES